MCISTMNAFNHNLRSKSNVYVYVSFYIVKNYMYEIVPPPPPPPRKKGGGHLLGIYTIQGW